MRKNIFLKSTIRQPLRMIAVMLLIGVAAFAFFLRTVEYVAVRAELTQLGERYTSSGFVRHQDFWADVSEAAELLESSRYVGSVENRVGLEGFLWNMQNADIGGMAWGVPREEQTRISELIFAGVLNRVSFWPEYGEVSWVILEVHLATMPMAGYHEQISTWLPTTLIYSVADDEEALARMEELQRGNIYLFHASYFQQFSPWGTLQLPNPNRQQSSLTLNEVREWNFDEWGWETTRVWQPAFQEYMYVQGALLYAPHFAEEIAFLNLHHRSVNLQPVRDMTTLPHVKAEGFWQLGAGAVAYGQPREPFRLPFGRLLTYEDYTEANPVAVVDRTFALIRNLQLGDVLQIEIPRTQEIYGINHPYREMHVRSTRNHDYETHVILVEIVGMYNNSIRNSANSTYGTGFIYIPASLLPDDMDITFNVPDMPDDALPSVWFHFTLASSRPEYEQRFMEHYRPIFEEKGFILTLFESGSREFWQIVDPIILTLTFNAVVFWAVLLLVFALVVFLYISSRRREMAIQQALGFSRKRIVLHMLVTALFFSVPGIIAGGIFGWRHAVYTAEYTLGGLSDILPGFVPAVELAPEWAYLMGGGVVAVLLLMIIGAAVYIMSFPVLSQLQGTLKRAGKKARASGTAEGVSEESTVAGLTVFKPLPAYDLAPAPRMNFANALTWVWRQISRSKVKTALVLMVAMFFVLVLGWLQEAIDRTETEIESLYDLTEVWGEVRQENPFDVHDGRYFGDVIQRMTIDLIRDTGYVTNMFIEAGHYRSFLVPPAPDGGFPANWAEIIGFDRGLPLRQWNNLQSLDMLFAFNDIEQFIELNTGDYDFGVGIEFHAGYGPEDFYYTEEAFANREPVPVILPESIMERRGFAPGDTVYLGYTRLNPANWFDIPVKIIGVHNSQVFIENAAYAAFIPLVAYEEMLRGLSFYTTFSFMIDTAHNREVTRIGETLSEIVSRPTAALGMTRLQLVMSSHDLYTLVGIADQTLLLLQLVYPLAVGASVFIAMGLSLLLMLQTAKTAAILRVLGASKGKAALMLLAELLLVCITGAALGLGALALLGATFGTQLAVMLGLYFGAVFIGAVAGAVIVFNRTPMSMLQVKE